MSRTSRYAFILAKMYGGMAKTYTGANIKDLLRLRGLEEVYDLLFPGERAAAQKEPLSVNLETRIMREGIRSMSRILFLLRDPPDILVHILRKFEYQSLKAMIRSLVRPEAEEPVVWDLGSYGLLRPEKRRDLEKTIATSRYAWILPHVRSKPLFEGRKSFRFQDRGGSGRGEAAARGPLLCRAGESDVQGPSRQL